MQSFLRIFFDQRFALAHLVLALALAATLFEYHLVKTNVEEGAMEEFNRELQINVGSAREGLQRYVYAVHDVASLIENNPALTADGWEKIMRSLEWHKHLPALRELGYAERGENGSLLVRFVTARDAHPVYRAGFDLASIPGARQTMQLSLDAQQPFGFGEDNCLLFVPSTRGHAFASFTANDLWDDLVRQSLQSQVDLRLLAYGEIPPPETVFCRTLAMTTWGFRWRFVATPRPTFARTTQLGKPPLFLAGGLALTVLLSAIAYGQAWRRIRVQQTNAELEKRIAARTSELQQALAREQELSRMKSNFVSTVSHEFRTPLGIIVSSAGILENYLDRLPPNERRDHLAHIQRSATHMAELMEGVLLFSRAEAGHVEFRPEPIHIEPLCQKVIDEVQSATNRRCPIEFSRNGTSTEILGDEALLRHILTNLLANAVKYSPAGQAVWLGVSADRTNVTFCIEDHGVGIPEADREKLFSAFYRGKNVDQVNGTGLGLFIVKKCVDLHGGRIQIDSTEGKGTTVTVTIPMGGKL